MKHLPVLVLIMGMSVSCIKDEGKIPSAAATGETSGGTSGGGSVTPSPDPLASSAWHLKNTGQATFADNSGVAGKDISLEEAIDQGVTGRGVTIAVSDSGTEHDHEDLVGNGVLSLHRNYFSSASSNWRGALPYPSGNDAHGTAVAGLIAAVGWNGIGSRGVAPDAKFGAFKFVMNYSSAVTNSSIIARTVDQTDGAFDIFNYSYGYSDCQFYEESEFVMDSIFDGVTNLRREKGAIYVQSAGNGYNKSLQDCTGITSTDRYSHNTNFSTDLATPYKIVVAALNAKGESASYSSPGSGIWVSAPGGEDGDDDPAMLTTDISGCNVGYALSVSTNNDFNYGSLVENSRCNYTSYMNGTSSAAPVLSGVVALLLQAERELSWRDIKHILATTATQVDPVSSVLPNPMGNELPGYDYDHKWNENEASYMFSNWYGFGMVDADAAVSMAKIYNFPLGEYETTANPNTGAWYYSSGALNLPIPDADAIGASHKIQVDHNFFVESVQIKVNINHALPGQLAVHLKSPAGLFESRLLNINSGVYAFSFPADKILMTNAFYGEESLGEWEIRVVDGLNGTNGTLVDWSILVHGHRINDTTAAPSAVSSIGVITPYPSKTISPPVTFTGSTSLDVLRYEVSVGSTPGATDKSKWTSIGLNTFFQVGQLRLTENTYYYVNVRAIDDRENASPVMSKVWYVEF